MNKYSVKYNNLATKQLLKMDKYTSTKLYRWIEKNLEGCTNPYFSGKRLKGQLSNFWRYRVGSYRILAEIDNQNIIIIIASVGHRKEIYD